MDKSKIASILAPFSPPLSATQIDKISDVITQISEREIGVAVKKAKARVKRPKTTRKLTEK